MPSSRPMLLAFALPLAALGLLACSSDESPPSSAGGAAGATSGGNGGSGGHGATGASGGAGGGGGTACEPFGRWPAPEFTFTLPATDGEAIVHSDIQDAFPEVDWSTVDRLYVPAGSYKAVNIGNLPTREASRPLIITNLGGQVRVGPNDPGGNYLWVMSGGANWVITGRYDEDAKTGDASVPGHRCGAYATARGAYGFLSDDAYAKGTYLHMGLAVSDATDFELEFLEITRSGFAGIRLLNKLEPGDDLRPMANVRVHDNYIHDADGEAIYFGWTGGPPSNLFTGLKVYNNRLIRAGNEALQVQDLGDGTEIYGNVMALPALRWRDNGLGKYQDNNAQIATRQGKIVIRDNVFLGGAGSQLSFWSQPQTGDAARNVEFRNNYFGGVRNQVGYFGGQSSSPSTFLFDANFFAETVFSYDGVDPSAQPPANLFTFGVDVGGDITFSNNRWAGSVSLLQSNKATTENNENADVAAIEFMDTGLPAGASPDRLEGWVAATTLAPGDPVRVYAPGDLVMYDAELYECLKQSSGEIPPDHPESWKKLAPPIDDFRVVPGSAYAGLGIR